VRQKRAIEERKKIKSSKLRMRKQGEDMRREEKDSSSCYRQRLVRAFAVARVQRNAAQRSSDTVHDVVIMSCRKVFQSLAVTARAEGLSELREHYSDSKSKDVQKIRRPRSVKDVH
jgi:hypothetical protein